MYPGGAGRKHTNIMEEHLKYPGARTVFSSMYFRIGVLLYS